MSNREHRRLRLVSPEPARSDGNSSVQVNEASSNRAQSTASVSMRQTPEPLSSSGNRPITPAQTPSLRNRVSMEDDLRGVDSRTAPHGVKRPRADSPHEGDSSDEPTPKRDKLLEELDSLEGKEENDYATGQCPETHAPVRESRNLPLRSQSKVTSARKIKDHKRQSEPEKVPELPLRDSGTEERVVSRRGRRRTPPAKE